MLCLVTDRRRLCGVTASFADERRRLVEQTKWAVKSSVDFVQIREPDLETAQLAAVVGDVVGVSRGSETRILVSDRLDVALACGAAGVHLRHDSFPTHAARKLVPDGFLVGRSVHTVADALSAGPVDYVIAGTVFETASKPSGSPLLGLDGLAAIVQSIAVPVLAIGGITAAQIDEVTATGAAGVAGIGLFIDWFERLERPNM